MYGGHRCRVPMSRRREIPVSEADTEPPVQAGFGAWRGVRRSGPHSKARDILISILGHSGPSLYGSGASRVPIDRLAEAPLLRAPRRSARHARRCATNSRARGARARGPHRPKRLVRVAQGHRGRPAAGSRRRTPSYKFIRVRTGAGEEGVNADPVYLHPRAINIRTRS